MRQIYLNDAVVALVENNILKSEQNTFYFANDIFQYNFLNARLLYFDSSFTQVCSNVPIDKKWDLLQTQATCHYLTKRWPSSLKHMSWWSHQMETFSALLALCAVNSPVTGEFPAQRPVTQSFHIFSDLRLNKRLSKQSWGWWFETPPRSLLRHCNGVLSGPICVNDDHWNIILPPENNGLNPK